MHSRGDKEPHLLAWSSCLFWGAAVATGVTSISQVVCVCVCPTPPTKHELGACGTSRSLLGVGGTPWWGGGQGGPFCPSPSCLALGFWNLHPTNLALSPSTSSILGGTRAQWGDVGVIQGSADMGGGVWGRGGHMWDT